MNTSPDMRRAAGCAALLAILIGWPATVSGAPFERWEVRSYAIPAGMKPVDATVRTERSGTTLVAGTVGTGERARCTVVVATQSSAAAYPYRQGDGGSRCVGAAIHPEGGFIVRGFGGRASKGEVAGFTARLDGRGRERWLLTDVALLEDSSFLGAYQMPERALAYSSATGRTLAFTHGTVRFGMLDQREVTYASIIRGGTYERRIQKLGSQYGFGRVIDAVWRSSNSRFLVALRRPSRGGTQLLSYDGAQQVDKYAPEDADWSERYVRDVEIGADGDVYLVWTETEKGDGATRVSAFAANGDRKWEKRYAATVDLGSSDGGTQLGTPAEIRVGSGRAVVAYGGRPLRMRGIDAESGDALGVATYPETENRFGLGLVYGRDGKIRVLEADTASERFREYRFGFNVVTGGEDTGTTDVGPAADGGDIGGGEGGCTTSGVERPLPLIWMVVIPIVAGRRRWNGSGTH